SKAPCICVLDATTVSCAPIRRRTSSGPAHVDLVPADHKRWRALYDGRAEPVAAQPVGNREAGDAGSRDQNVYPRLAPPARREAVAIVPLPTAAARED